MHIIQVLDDCAEMLYQEMVVRGTCPGLSVMMEGRLKSLQSVSRKMARKRCSIQQVCGWGGNKGTRKRARKRCSIQQVCVWGGDTAPRGRLSPLPPDLLAFNTCMCCSIHSRRFHSTPTTVQHCSDSPARVP